MKNVSAVIPNYNGQSLLKKFLPYVLRTLDNNDELIVVDDNSTDNSIKYLIKEYKLKLTKQLKIKNIVSKEYFPQLKNIKYKLYKNNIKVGKNNINLILISLEENMRFAAAANTGVLFSNNDYILLLNSDVKPTKELRNQLIQHFNDPLIFGVGCLEYEKDETGEKSGKNKLWFYRGMFMHSKAQDMSSGPTAWVSGGSGMFDKQKWIYLNGFDQLFYPAYWEDLDLSYRARKEGWKTLFDEKAVVYHIHESTNMDIFGQQKIMHMSWLNLSKYLKKHATFWQLIQYYFYKPYWIYAWWKHNKKMNKIII